MTHEEMIQLQVGDVVCDCRFLHLKVSSLEERLQPNPSFYRLFRWLLYLPFLDGAFLWLDGHWPSTGLVDKDLVLEDGACCSAMSCCSTVPHEWEHPTLDSQT